MNVGTGTTMNEYYWKLVVMIPLLEDINDAYRQ